MRSSSVLTTSFAPYRFSTFLILLVAFNAFCSEGHGQTAGHSNPVEVVPNMGHGGDVYAVAISPDGRWIATGAITIKLWDFASGRLVRTFAGHPGGLSVMALSFDPASRQIVSAGNGHPIKVWDMQTGVAVVDVDDSSGKAIRANFMAVSPNGRVIAHDDFESIKLVDARMGTLLRKLDGRGPLAFSPDGARLAAQTSNSAIAVFEAATGRKLQVVEGHSLSVNAFASHGETAKAITSIAFSHDGKLLASASEDRTIKVWDAATGRLLRSIKASVRWLAFSPDGNQIVSAGAVWNVDTGRLVRRLSDNYGAGALSRDGRWLVASDDNRAVRITDLTNVVATRTLQSQVGVASSVALSADGRRLLSGGWDKKVRLWDLETGALIRSLQGHKNKIYSVALSPDGRYGASGDTRDYGNPNMSQNSVVNIWDLETGRRARSLEHLKGDASSVAFSPDGKLLLSSGTNALVWDSVTGHLRHQFPTMVGSHAVFSPDGRHVISTGAGIGQGIAAWDVRTGTKSRDLGRAISYYTPLHFAFTPDGSRFYASNNDKIAAWDFWSGNLVGLFGVHQDETLHGVTAMAVASSGNKLVTGAWNGTIKVWPLNSVGAGPLTIRAHGEGVRSVAVSSDGARTVSASSDGTVRLWDARDGGPIATLVVNEVGDWIAITPKGFFAGTPRATENLSVVRGLEVTTIGQVHQSLFNPDLVREVLAGDPSGEVRAAAQVTNLEKVLDSGPAPIVAITSPPGGSQSPSDLVTVTARIEDRGKGIGRIEWRVNGVTAVVAGKPPGGGPTYTVTQQLALDPGDNDIEAMAYNASNLLTSLPARTTLRFTGPADKTKPKLHVLAIGINAYIDKGWAPPASAPRAFAPLGLAVKDAESFGASLKKAAAGLYGEVRLTLALDKDATRDNLEKIVAKIAADVHPRDSFILFAAGHGTSENGRFYLIPQDYQSGPGHLAQYAIGQGRLQDWLANRIKAKRAIILLDTCESGALIAGHARSRTDAPASEAAVGRLHEATGRPVLTAAAAGQFAHEGLIGETGERHGVFTWAVLDALRKGDTNGNGTIELSELVRHVQSVVPKVAAGVVRAATSEPVLGRQAARFGSRGEDFAVAQRLP